MGCGAIAFLRKKVHIGPFNSHYCHDLKELHLASELHKYFSNELPKAVKKQPKDVPCVKTLQAYWNLAR
jgi:hypothetical protein